MIDQTNVADSIIKGVSELNTLTYEYLSDTSKRAKMQWQLKHNSITELLNRQEPKDTKTEFFIKKIHEKHKNHAINFKELAKSYETENIKTLSSSVFREFQERTMSNILILSREIITEAEKLVRYSNEQLYIIHNRSNLTIICTITVLALIITLAILFNGRAIISALTRLNKGTKIIANGNLDYKVSAMTPDEIGDLSSAFNIMTQKLKETYTALTESEEKFRGISASANDAIIMMDENGNITYWNKSAERILGYSSNESLGKTLHDFIMPHCYQEPFKSGFEEFSKTGQGKLIGKSIEVTTKKKGGAEIPAEISISSLNLNNKWHSIGILRDITARKNAELELRKAHDELEARVKERTCELSSANEHLRAEIKNRIQIEEELHLFKYLINNSNDAVFVIDPLTTMFKDINEKACLELQYDKNDLLKMGIADIDEQDESKWEEHVKELKEKKYLIFEGIHRRKDTTVFDVEMNLKYLEHKRGNYIVAISRDITSRKQNEKILRQNAENLKLYSIKLEQSNADLQEFAYIASHDLQEPLRKVTAFGNRITSKYSDVLQEQGRDYLLRMTNAASRMQQLIDDLLELSRVSTKARPFQRIELNEVLREVLEDIDKLIIDTNGRVTVDNLPAVNADEVQVRQLFQNLILNALKFHKQNRRPVITIKNRSLNNEFCEIMVNDDGIGFDVKYADRIFKPFQRLHGKNEYSGSGIGLAICKKIIDRHNGKIYVKSQEDKGSAFYVTLPLA